METRFNIDVQTGLPHIYKHGVSEEVVGEALHDILEVRTGSDGVFIAVGRTLAGQTLRLIYRELSQGSLFVITAFGLTGKPLAAFRRRQRRRGRR